MFFLLLLLLSNIECKMHALNCTRNDPVHIPHEWYEPGDLLIGGMVSLIHYVSRPVDFTEHPSLVLTEIPLVLTRFYQNILALVFAVDTINDNPKILPNVTLGFHIYDSYSDSKMTYRTTLDLLFKSNQFVPNYKCGIQENIIGVIGGLSSFTSSRMADILGIYKIPQLLEELTVKILLMKKHKSGDGKDKTWFNCKYFMPLQMQ
ncbi:vomeronasal type-2 receptor 26-like [Podarcis muralis]